MFNQFKLLKYKYRKCQTFKNTWEPFVSKWPKYKKNKLYQNIKPIRIWKSSVVLCLNVF